MLNMSVESQVKAHIKGLINRLDGWLISQRKLIDDLQKYADYVKSQDRYTLLLSAQAMIYYIERTAKDFESWLNNPLITSIMTPDMLKELEAKLRELAINFIKIDLEHTGQYLDLLKKYDASGEIPEILRLYFEHRIGGVQEGGQQRGGEEMPRFL